MTSFTSIDSFEPRVYICTYCIFLYLFIEDMTTLMSIEFYSNLDCNFLYDDSSEHYLREVY